MAAAGPGPKVNQRKDFPLTLICVRFKAHMRNSRRNFRRIGACVAVMPLQPRRIGDVVGFEDRG